VTIYHGDCRDVMPLLVGPCTSYCLEECTGRCASPIAVMVTDPPYGMSYSSGWSGRAVVGDKDTTARDAILSMWGGALLSSSADGHARPETTRLVLTWDKGDWPGMGDLALPWGPSTEEVYVLGAGFRGEASRQRRAMC
jgi:hypothetical protein